MFTVAPIVELLDLLDGFLAYFGAGGAKALCVPSRPRFMIIAGVTGVMGSCGSKGWSATAAAFEITEELSRYSI